MYALCFTLKIKVIYGCNNPPEKQCIKITCRIDINHRSVADCVKTFTS